MEMKEIAKHKTLWKMSSTSEPLFITGIEVSPLKKFTIPKIKRRAGKVYLSPCCTNTREYSFIHDTLNQCRLDVSCDLQSSWQFGDTKLIHNEDLEKNFTAKRSEMRERRKHGRELEEHFCFLALPQSDVLEIYQNGISTKASTLKILGNPHLGIYIFRHVDVALNYAHSRNIMVENIIIFKVLFGRVKKIQPSMDKNKVSLDPSPNFDCHMSRNLPSLKDTIELQAYSSAVYFYEYNIFSKPVDKPRQCLPYAIVTVKFIGHKVDSGHFVTSLRFLSAGFPKRAERTCSLNNCTVAKRIGKGKDATVIFEHFRKPVDPFVEENCSCNVLNSEINPSSSSISNSYGNMQNGNTSILEAYNEKTENNLAEIRDSSQIHEHDSGVSLPSDNRESDNGDFLLNLTYLKNILSGISAAFPPHNNTGSSTVTTSKLIKDPRLMKREESSEKQNITVLNEILPFKKSIDYDNSEINLSSVPADSVSSPEVTSDHTILTNCLDVSCFKFSFDDSQPQTQNTEDHHRTAPNKITMAEQCKDQGDLSFPVYFSNIVSEVENQKHSEEKAQRAQEKSNISLLIKQSSEPCNSYKSVSTCTEEYNSYISQEPQSIAQKLMELKLEKTNKNCVSIMPDAFQEAKDISQAKDLLIDTVITSHAIETSLDNSNCNITREYICAQRKSESEPVSLENIQRDCKEMPHIEDEDHILYYNVQLNNDLYLNTNFKWQRYNDKENENEAEEEDSAVSPENIENVYGGKKQGFLTNNTMTNISERRENKNYNKVEILSSKEFSTTFNLVWEDKDKSTETALLESEDTIIAIKQRDMQSTGRNVEHLDSTAFVEIADSSVGEVSNATVEVASTTMPTLSTNYEAHQRFEFKDTCFESPHFGSLVKHGISDCEIDMDKNKLKDSLNQSINENSVLQSSELQNEIEIESEQCDTHSHGNVLYEEVEASYEALMSRIDWKSLLGSDNGEKEILESTTKKENIDQHCSKKIICFYSSTQKEEELHPILLPDLQVRITNICKPGFNPNDDSLVIKDNSYKYITKATNPEINEREAPGFKIYSQPPGENSGYPCEDTFGNSLPDSGITNENELSHSSHLSHNTQENHKSEKQSSGSLSTKPNIKIINDKCRYFFSKSKKDFNDTKSKNDTESRISKRKLHASFRDENISHEICEKKRKLTNQDSFECFSSLSQGRIKIFSQSERHIRSVLDILNSEASLCKSKRLSRTLDKAVLHLKKAHRRVHTSLQLIAKVGEKRKGPLPKAYAIICNSFWESCDLQGYSSVSERRYYSTKHFLSKRKYDKQEEKRTLGFDVDKTLAYVSKHKSYKTNGEKIAKCHSKKRVATSVSRSHTTIHVGEFYDLEQNPESHLPLFSTSQSTSQSEYDNSLRHSRSSELQPFAGRTECLLYPDEKLTKKENQIDIKVSNSEYKKLENHSAHNNTKDVIKDNNSDANKVINEINSVSLNCIKENNPSYNADRNYEGTCIAHTKVKTDISVSDSNVKHIYEQENLSSSCKRNLEVNVSIDKYTTAIESCKPNIIAGNFLMGPLNLTSIINTKYSTPQLLSATPMIAEGKSSENYLNKQRIFSLDSSISGTVSHCQQMYGGMELLNTEPCSSSNCFLTDEGETNGIGYSELDLTSVTEESKSYGENIMNKLPSNGSSLLLKDNIRCSSKKCIAKKDLQARKNSPIKQAEKEDSIYKRGTTEGLTVKYKNQNSLKEEPSCLNMKKIRSNSVDSNVSIKNTAPEAVSLSNTISGQPNKRQEWGIKVTDDSQSHCISKLGIQAINCIPFLHAQSEACKVTDFQKPVSYVNELNEKYCSTNYTAFIAELSQILQRADEASSFQILEEEMKICRNILPLFVEAFERKQECSLEQILISRELLVEQNLWNNCKYKLKPCAVDALVELQMVMETIQFIENKKRLLKGEPTFRSLLWYDETLYSELLCRPRGYQLQSNFYPAFQGRLKYNAFCELQNYRNQLSAKTKKNNSYYVFLKYKRQINECEAILKHCSDCFDFSLSIPFTCGVNCGDSLGDLETLRKSTLKLISKYEDSPKVYTYPGKEDHLWIIIDLISSKVKFIKSTEAVTIKISLYGLEHIYFDAAKNLVWKERRKYFSKKYLQKNEDMLLKMNEYAFSKLQEIHEILSKDLNSELTSSIGLETDTMITFRKSHDLVSQENCRFNSTLLSHPGICYIGEILDQAEIADLKKLQELTLRCTDHLEILKKYFQMLQEVNIDDIFITEENALDVLQNYNHGAIILKPEAIETYIEIVMLSETVHFLKNSMAKKLDNQRFRGMLWFDFSLLPELICCQEKMASFSFLKDNPDECLYNVIETAISELKEDLDIISKYSEAVNCSYALHLFSRELEELSEIKKLLKKSEYSLSTYIDFVPYIASINYGNTVTELEHNYDQFSTLLQNIMSIPQKDLGKMAHIMKVMKTIEHMKIICAKNAKLSTSFLLCQMAHNRRDAFQLKKEEKMNIHAVKPEENTNKSSLSMKVPSISECIIKNFPNSSKKQPIHTDKCEDSQEEEKNTTSCCKKQKVSMKDVTKIYKAESAFKKPRTTRSHCKIENEKGSNSSDNLKRNYVSPKMIEMQSSLLPLKTLQNACTSRSESNIDLTNSSSGTSEHITRQHKNLSTIKKRKMSFSVAETKSDENKHASFAPCDQRNIDDTFAEDHNITDPTQKSCLSNINPGTDDCLVPNAAMFSKPVFHFLREIHTNLEMNDTVLECQDNEMLNSSIKNSTCIISPEPTHIQGKISILQENKKHPAKTESEEKYMKNTLKPSMIPFGQTGILTLDVNQRAEYSLSEQQDENPKVLNKKGATYWNELPQSACNPIYNSSEHSFGATSYPYYSWCVYHYSSSNGNAITHTYQGIESYEVYPPPSGILTTVASTVQTTHSNILYSQYFSCFAEQPQANAFMPADGYFQSQRPISYNFQQPIFSQYASHQPLPQAAYPYPPNSGVLQEVPWIYAPWQQEQFQPGH
ncbi:testis-expressed protein 15 [Urocitellus parryii]